MANLERNILASPYHYCSRCGDRKKLSELEWQVGLLVCTTGNVCIDKRVLGQIEVETARILRQCAENPDAMPDQKLLQPTGMDNPDIIFNI
jgi:hypothetical protein